MTISAIGMQSYSIQSIMNQYKNNILPTADNGKQTTNIINQVTDHVTISENAQDAAQAATDTMELNEREYKLLKLSGLSDDDVNAFQKIKHREMIH